MLVNRKLLKNACSFGEIKKYLLFNQNDYQIFNIPIVCHRIFNDIWCLTVGKGNPKVLSPSFALQYAMICLEYLIHNFTVISAVTLNVYALLIWSAGMKQK